MSGIAKQTNTACESKTLKVRGGIISQANRYLDGFCFSQGIFPPQIIHVLLLAVILYPKWSLPKPSSLFGPFASWINKSATSGTYVIPSTRASLLSLLYDFRMITWRFALRFPARSQTLCSSH